ncbi:MAG: DNA translocase FtsK [Clostridia bacterium]|nr:DNA translocase FtsK [Clostridia bacterium]
MLLHILGGGGRTIDVKSYYNDGCELIGGGVVGGVLGELLLRGFGSACSLILLFTAIVFLSLYVAGITPRGLVIWIAYKIKFSGEKRAEMRAVKEEKRRTAPKSRQQIREEEYLEYLREKKKKEKEARIAAEKAEREKGGEGKDAPAEQLPMGTPPSTVYHVKRRRRPVVDVPVYDAVESAGEEAPVVRVNTETGEVLDDIPMTETADDAPVKDDGKIDRGAVDEQIFDEVMKRTRERIEKSRKTQDLHDDLPKKPRTAPAAADDFSADSEQPQSIEAGEVLDAVEVAAIDLHEKRKRVSDSFKEPAAEPEQPVWEEIPDDQPPFDVDEPAEVKIPASSTYAAKRREETARTSGKAESDETDTVRLAMDGDEGDFDVTKIFVNPGDAELLDKLSEQYMRDPLEVKRETVASPVAQSEPAKKLPLPEYKFPPIEILQEDTSGGNESIKEELQENAVKLVETLASFNVKTKIENISRGPTITRYELVPERGIKVRSIANLVDDISLSLATMGVRIEAPIPGKAAVGIEVPNKKKSTVHLRTLIEDSRFQEAPSKLTVALGADVAGDAVYFDIGKMPHLLIAGATGAGKSVCINSVITSLLYKASPEDVKLILIDPKKVELNIYNGIPHLLVPVVSEPKKAAGSLSWAVGEMERRYSLIEAVGVRDIKAFNEVTKNDPDYEYMPRIVIIIDELADLMMTASDDVEDSICRIAQKARAAGMHLIIGTQRPSVDVITGLIKANVPSRIAFRTSSQIDSRTIIDIGAAANLIGMGDMLFNPVGALKPIRVQGAYVSENDVEEVVSYIKNMNTAFESTDTEKIVNEIEREAQKCGAGKKGASAGSFDDEDGDEEDPMFMATVELAVESGKISTSLIQRKLHLGYGRAAKIIDRMEQMGYVSAPDGSKPRDVLITKQEFMEMRLKSE